MYDHLSSISIIHTTHNTWASNPAEDDWGGRATSSGNAALISTSISSRIYYLSRFCLFDWWKPEIGKGPSAGAYTGHYASTRFSSPGL